MRKRPGVSIAVVRVIIGDKLLRLSPLVDSWWGRVALSTLHVAAGTAPANAERIFWLGALCYRGKPEGEARLAVQQGARVERVTPRSRA